MSSTDIKRKIFNMANGIIKVFGNNVELYVQTTSSAFIKMPYVESIAPSQTTRDKIPHVGLDDRSDKFCVAFPTFGDVTVNLTDADLTNPTVDAIDTIANQTGSFTASLQSMYMKVNSDPVKYIEWQGYYTAFNPGEVAHKTAYKASFVFAVNDRRKTSMDPTGSYTSQF